MAELRAGLDAVLDGVVAQREQLAPGGLACAALACARLGRKQDAARLLDAMWARAQASGQTLSLPGSNCKARRNSSAADRSWRSAASTFPRK